MYTLGLPGDVATLRPEAPWIRLLYHKKVTGSIGADFWVFAPFSRCLEDNILPRYNIDILAR